MGWQAKEVLAVGGQKVALVQTGGIASVKTAATGQLAKFDTTQKTATIHVETFPNGQAFAFKE